MIKDQMVKELVAELAFYGVHETRSDDRGRVWVPRTMLYGNVPDRFQDPLHVGDKFYLRKEDTSIRATLLTPQLHSYYYELSDDDPQRESYFLGGRVVTVRGNDSKGNGGRRITLGAALKELEFTLAGYGHFFEITPNEEDLAGKNIDWNSFNFRKHLKEDEE